MPVEDELVPAPAPVEAPMSAAAAAPARAPAPAVAPQATPPHIPSPTLRSPLRDITPPPDAEACPSASPCNIGGEHDDDAGQPRRRKRPSRAGRSRSRDPPQRDVVLERSRYFSKPASDGRPSGTTAVSNGMASADLEEDAGRVRVDLGDANAMHDLKRAIGLSPHRLSPVDLPDDDEDEDFTRSTGSSSKGKGKQKVTFGEPGSEDYPFDFEMDDSFLEQVSRVEHEAYLRETSSQMNGKSQNQPPAPTGTQVKSEPRSQSASGTLFGATATATTLVGTQRGAIGGVGRDMPMEVIDISDEEVEIDKENVPAPTRHVRRRVAPVENVIELSD
ncbi:hypothetical protein BD414DRAFT_493876 [Trametes punicea]|nr:hypothetical protein BD414DRAFT_493876 [Trametes punicea]